MHEHKTDSAGHTRYVQGKSPSGLKAGAAHAHQVQDHEVPHLPVPLWSTWRGAAFTAGVCWELASLEGGAWLCYHIFLYILHTFPWALREMDACFSYHVFLHMLCTFYDVIGGGQGLEALSRTSPSSAPPAQPESRHQRQCAEQR